ncbi:Gfo/Idh/MocA family oxidoreductase [Paenibacillus sp. P96]|uniref:Gfo/Idh/MocA family oxidoreductase n=1 Tax=Paenibacillus zeirhizosphaerae TaxID=2987519 RepID=A0ABT9FT78_9BACL|nr:Gfo/Idh/MocA family oxidoreductase [Paenibacillus sp. P96]MDP4097820.1 Gfo/Idh/MocA family oxidoreductase [Paenibacillus sp. P96]
MKQLGAAIIGCGSIHPLHALSVSELEDVTLRLLVDRDRNKAEAAASEYGGEAADDYLAILEREDIDVVHLCTPHHEHAGMAVELLKAGKHVVTEKPLAAGIEAAERMVQAADHSKGQLGVVLQNRYNESSQTIYRIIESGELGRLVGMKGIVTWHRNEGYYAKGGWRGKWATEGGGVLINQAIHTLDLLQWFGGPVEAVRGSVTTDVLDGVIEVEDTAHAHFRFASGATAILYATNAYAVNSPVELEIVFEQGTLHQRRDCLYLSRDGRETLLCEPPLAITGAKSYWGTGHRLMIRDFYAHVREGKKFWLDGTEGIKSLRLVKQVYEASRTAHIK